MSRRPRFAVLILALALLALPLLSSAKAEAGPTLGISQSYRDFGLNLSRSGNYETSRDITSSFYWVNTGVGTMRVIVPWDLGLRPLTNGRLREFENWLKRVTELGGQPYVVLAPTEERVNLYDSRQPTRRAKPEGPVAPMPETYRAAVKAFLKRWGPKGERGKVWLLGAWNEPNLTKIDMSIPDGVDGKIYLPSEDGMRATTTPMTSWETCGDGYASHCGPLMGVLYWWYAQQEMQAACSGTGRECYAVAGEFASAPSASKEGKPYWETYANEMERLITARPQIISFHAHRDVKELGANRTVKDGKTVDHDCRPGNESWCITAMFYKWLKGRGGKWADRSYMQIWNTETGARHALGNPAYGGTADGAQRERFEFLYSLSTIYRVKRLYYFNFQTAGDTDRGLINQGSNVNTTVRPIWQFFRQTNCPTDCGGPKHLGSIILESEEPFLEPPLPEDPTEEDAPPPPTAETRAATRISKTGATLNGSVNPAGTATNYYFEYGTTEDYGNVRPAASAGNGTTANVYSEAIWPLRPGTTYHYRIVASSSVDTSYGEDQTFTTLATPRESDVTGDGRSDLVVLRTDGNAYTYPGQPNGSFGAAVSSRNGEMDPAQADGTGYFPIDVEDVNGDGFDDLVTMHSSGTVGTYLGLPDGHFNIYVESLSNGASPAILGPGGGNYEPIGVGDTNGDGRGDLVLLNEDGTVQTFLAAPNGGFPGPAVTSLAIDSATFDSQGEYPLDIADLNDDGLADLVTQKTNGSIATYFGDGGGVFRNTPAISLAGMLHPSMENGSGYEPVGVADVDGDGYGDLVVHHSSGTLSTYRGNGAGLFITKVDTPGSFDSDLYDGTGSDLATVIDVNGDGSADLVSSKRSDGNVYVTLGQPNGSFGAATTNLGGAYASTRANRRSGSQMVMEKPIRRRDGCRPTGCGVDPRSDVNGDHRADLVTLGASGGLATYLGATNVSFSARVASHSGELDPAQYDGSGYYPVAVEDVNGDGYDDLVTMHSSGTVGTYLGQSGGGFGAYVASLTNALVPALLRPVPGEYEPIGVGDANGDRRGDLVVYNAVDGSIYTFPGQAGGGFSSTKVSSLTGTADSAHFDAAGDYFLDVVDVTGDGLADLVAQNTNGNGETYKATGSGGFAAAPVTSFGGTMNPSMATGTGYEPIAVVDVNGDARADLVAHHSNGRLYTYLGQGSGAFGTRVESADSFDSDLYDGSGSELATVIDLTGDGFADLVWLPGDGRIFLQRGRRDGGFISGVSVYGENFLSSRRNRSSGEQIVNEQPLRRRSPCLATGCGLDPKSDVNGDHRADLVALHTSGTVSTYRGRVAGIFDAPVSSHEGELDPAQYDGSGYYPLAIEDINGDSRDDLVSMHSSGSVYTFLGQAEGTVTTTVTSLSGALAPSVLWPGVGEFEPIGVGDATGDRRGDLIAFNNVDRTVYTYPGQANGGFSNAPVASLTLISGTGNGDSAFFDSVGDYFVDVADVTGDGLADLVAQNTNGNGETYVATGSGEFHGTPVTSFAGAMKTSLATGGGHEPVAVADVNGDGRADFVAHGGSTLSAYLGQANGSFTTRADTVGSFDSNLFDGIGAELGSVIDVNGDGFGDLVWTKGDGKLYVQKGRRDGTFSAAQAEAEGTFSSTRHNRASGSQMVNEQPIRRRSACAANGCGLDLRSDVDGDHRADLVTLHTSGSAYTYRGQISGEFAAGKASSLTLASGSNGVLDPAQYDGVGYYPLGVEDVNGDRYDDFVALDSSGTVSTYTGQLDGGFSGAEIDSLEGELPPAILTATPGKYEPIGLGDATGDGRGDLVVFNNVDKTVYTYPGQANGKFSSARVASLTLASGSGNADSALFDSAGDYFVGVADVTGDGLADLVAQSTNGNGETYKATGGGGFSATPVISFAGTVAPSLATGTGYEPVAVADVNGDGRADFVTHQSSGTVYTYLGQTSGAFTSRVAASGSVDSNLYDGTGYEFGTVIDVNGDGFADLISANRGDGNVYVQPGKRTGSFGYGYAQLGGTYVSTRHSQASGQQMVSELPIRRRSACAANGCH